MCSDLISIIVPVYNAEKTIIKCLESIINQTHKKIEIIIIDDGSIDDSYALCEEYQIRDPRIILLKQENLGVSKARNKGLDIANGGYIGFVDSDDYIDCRMYERLLAELKSKQCQMSICNYFFEDSFGNQMRSYDTSSELFFSNQLPLKMIDNLAINGYLCNKLYKRSLIDNLRFDEELRILEDNLFNYRVFERNPNFKCSYISDKLYHYIQYSGSASNNKYNYKHLQYFIVRDKQIDILDKKALDSNFLKADYVINFVKTRIKFRLLELRETELYKAIQSNSKEYIPQVKIHKLNLNMQIKYVTSRWFPIIYWVYIILKKENI